MPLFSVIIPTYNRAAFLREALASVFAQSFTDYEVIVVDDGSTDGTAGVVQGYGPQVRLLQQPNRGPGAARNLGAQHATGDYLAFLDSDDIWLPWTLATFADLLRRHGLPAILSSKFATFADEKELSGIRHIPITVDAFPDYFSASLAGYFVGAGMSVIRSDAFSRAGGFTNRRINAEDHDLIMRMGCERGFVAIKTPVTLGWRRHSCSTTMHVELSFAGGLYLVQQETKGVYPGGAARATERRTILTRHIRPVTLDCLRCGAAAEAWMLYRATFRWHVELGRWKYLFGFPAKAISL